MSELVDRLILKKEHAVITRHGKPVAALMPYDEWERYQAGGAGGLAEAKGTETDLDSEIGRMVEEIYEARAKSKPRKVRL